MVIETKWLITKEETVTYKHRKRIILEKIRWEDDPLPEIYICLYEQVVYTQPRLRPGEWDALLRDFDKQIDCLISARPQDLVIFNNKKENLPNSGLCCVGRQQSNIKESKKQDNYLDYAKDF